MFKHLLIGVATKLKVVPAFLLATGVLGYVVKKTTFELEPDLEMMNVAQTNKNVEPNDEQNNYFFNNYISPVENKNIEEYPSINFEQFKRLNRHYSTGGDFLSSPDFSTMKSSDISPTLWSSFKDETFQLSPLKSFWDLANQGDYFLKRMSLNKYFNIRDYFFQFVSQKSLFENWQDKYKQDITSSAPTNPLVKKIYSDLIASLLEQSELEELIIRPNIDIDFLFDGYSTQKGDSYIAIKNFSFSFVVINKTREEKMLFQQLKVPANTEFSVKITLPKSHLKVFSKDFSLFLNTKLSWSLFPIQGNLFNVEIKKINSTNEKIIFQTFKELKLIYSYSQIFGVTNIDEHIDIDNLENKFLYPMPTRGDYEKIVKPKLMAINKEQIKKDIERWYGPYQAGYLGTLLNDLTTLLNFLNAKISVDSGGKKISYLSQILTNKVFRDSIWTAIKLPDSVKILMDNLAEKVMKGTLETKEIEAFLSSFVNELQKIKENLKLEITWENEPEIQNSQDDEYPTVSFKFSNKYTFTGNVGLSFKGGWDTVNNQTVTWEEEESTRKSKTNVVYFDLPSIFEDTETLFKAVLESTSGRDDPRMHSLIKELKDFIGWNKIIIAKDEKIENIYVANNSPMHMMIFPQYDVLNYRNHQAIIGWGLRDVQHQINLSNFHQIFPQIFQKLMCYQKQGDSSGFGANEAAGVLNAIKDSPLKTTLHIMNSLLGQGYSKSGSSQGKLSSCDDMAIKDTNEYTKPKNPSDIPLHVFFSSLLQKVFTRNHSSFLTGYTSAVYEYPDNFDEALKNLNTTTSSSPGVKAPDISIQNVDFYAIEKKVKYKHKTSFQASAYPVRIADAYLEKLAKKTIFSHGFSFPEDSPIVPSPLVTDAVNKMVKKMNSDPRFSTKGSLLKNIDQLKDLLKETYEKEKIAYNEKWRFEKQMNAFNKNIFMDNINWDEVKLSWIDLGLENALQNLLTMNTKLGLISHALSTAGITLNDLLGNMFKRDHGILSITLPLENGMWESYFTKALWAVKYSASPTMMAIIPGNIQHCDINAGKTVKGFLGCA